MKSFPYSVYVDSCKICGPTHSFAKALSAYSKAVDSDKHTSVRLYDDNHHATQPRYQYQYTATHTTTTTHIER